jgi:hypothetical protein
VTEGHDDFADAVVHRAVMHAGITGWSTGQVGAADPTVPVAIF